MKTVLHQYVTSFAALEPDISPPQDIKPVRPLRQRLGPEGVAVLVAGYESGASSAALAKQFGVSKSGVKQLLHELGVAMRTRRSLTLEEIDVTVELYTAGCYLREVGDRLGCDPETVRRALLGRGVVMRSGHGNHAR